MSFKRSVVFVRLILIILSTTLIISCGKSSSSNSTSGVNQPATDFTLPVFENNQSVSLSDYQGTVIILDFWAHWCSPCDAIVEELKVVKQAVSDNVIILGIAIYDDSIDFSESQAKITTNQIPWQNLKDTTEVHLDYGIYSKYSQNFPLMVIIDKNFNIVHELVGQKTAETILGYINPLL